MSEKPKPPERVFEEEEHIYCAGPYQKGFANLAYQSLFCDRIDLYMQSGTEKSQPPWSILFAEDKDWDAINEIARDEANESRVRMLAFNQLREAGTPVPPGIYLGTILEHMHSKGLITVAVFADGGVRHTNYQNELMIVEDPQGPHARAIKAVHDASMAVLAATELYTGKRHAPEIRRLRITFLTSDGMRCREEPEDDLTASLSRDPLIAAMRELLEDMMEDKDSVTKLL